MVIRSVAAQEVPRELLLLADPSDEMVDSYLNRGQCFGAELSGQIVGEMVFIETRPKTLELVNLAVDEAWQARGIGRALIAHGIEYARSRGVECVELGTGNSSIRQLAFYQQCGFRIVGVDGDFFTRHYPQPIWERGILCRDMVRMALYLG